MVRGQEKYDEMRTSCHLFVKRDGPIWEHGAAGKQTNDGAHIIYVPVVAIIQATGLSMEKLQKLSQQVGVALVQ